MNGRWSGWGSLALVAFQVAGCSLLPGGEPTLDSALRARQLMVPVAGVSPDQVPDNFRAPRSGARIHGAVDIPAPRGTPVLSADDGRVLRLQRNRKGGLTIYATDESEHFIYYYAHLDAYCHGLAKDTRLVRGQVIGSVGTTGDAHRREPHLHFQVMVRPSDGRWWSGDAIDPRPYFTSAGRAKGKRTTRNVFEPSFSEAFGARPCGDVIGYAVSGSPRWDVLCSPSRAGHPMPWTASRGIPGQTTR